MNEKVLVLGGDGFCGWPTSLHLSDNGHDVVIVDNLSRRRIDEELETQSLTPISSIEDRLDTWKKVSRKEITFENVDIAQDYDGLLKVIQKHQPDSIVHFAEQRSAPYSMMSAETGRYTVDNNVNATNNLLTVVEASKLNIHIVHLGTMGVYGYGWAGDASIPEGYLNVKVEIGDEWVDRKILHPTNPGSIYHMTKVLDQNMFALHAKLYDRRITDLHQGIVWGTQTDQTIRDEKLINRFDYDEVFGTVFNRFLVEAALDYPLTVYGTGGQKRAFIHVRDTAKCVELAIKNPPEKGDLVKIFNQVTETHKVRDLAEMVAKASGVKIDYLPNPRLEAAENELVVTHDYFAKLGLEPTTLSDGLMAEVEDIAREYADRVDKSKIPPRTTWKSLK